MKGWFLITLSIFVVCGCATRPSREGVLSKALPLTVDDLAEIREGEKNHLLVLEEYELYESPKAEIYLNAIAESIAEVSTRPNLPYKVILLDTDEVNTFGGPGGYIYMTRGLLNFVESETELAGILAHEIAHIAGYEYSTIPQVGKMSRMYKLLKQGSDLASDSIGTYGTAAKYTLRGIDKAKPHLSRRYSRDEEVEADKKAVQYLTDAGYNPNGFEIFNERLATLDINDVNRFVLYMNTHPPFQERRVRLKKMVKNSKFKDKPHEERRDMLSEVRQQMVNQVVVAAENKEVDVEENEETTSASIEMKESVIFKPALGSHLGSPGQIDENASSNNSKLTTQRKRLGWFTL